MPWDPLLDITGDRTFLKVSATDVASDAACGRFLAFKVRPMVKSAAWRRSFARESIFPLGDVVDVVLNAHAAPETQTYAGLDTWLSGQLERRGVHRLLRPYVRVAVENVLEAHEAIEGVIGPLKLIGRDPVIGPSDRQLTAWAPVYETADGTREIRRIRVGSAHYEPDEDDARWAATAGYVATTFRVSPRRIRVVEIGAADGSTAVLFDGTPEEAAAAFVVAARSRARDLVDEDHVVPCQSCGDCKIAGACAALLQVDGMLGQATPGIASRSVSPTALEQYARCPGRWLLDANLHLPKERSQTEALVRGNAVHRWLEAAHRRGVACAPADLPTDGTLGLAEGLLSPEEFTLAAPFLARHVDLCPLAIDGTAVVEVEQFVHGWDEQAQVVMVTKPDLVYMLGDRLIVRETKTAGTLPLVRTRRTTGTCRCRSC